MSPNYAKKKREMVYEGQLRRDGAMGGRKQATANRYAPALGNTYIKRPG